MNLLKKGNAFICAYLQMKGRIQVKNKNHLFLASDFGTQGVRVGVADVKGKLLNTHEVKYPIHYPEPGQAIQDSSEWWKGFKEALKVVLSNLNEQQKNDIQALSICATSSTVVPVDKEGKALDSAIMWMDIRAKDIAKKITEMGHPVLDYCGDSVSAEWFIPKVIWLKENKREIYDKADRIVEQIDFINYKMTNVWSASKVNAVCKWNYINGMGFNEEYMEQIGLEDYKEKIILNVIPMGDKVGNLTKELANEFEINEIPIIQGGIDAHIGTIGMGVVGPGKLAANMGTSFVQLIFTESDLPIKGIWGPYKGAMVKGLTLLEAGQISAGSIIKWYQTIFDLTGPEAFQTMKEEVETVPLGSDGIRALDFFQGNRTPYKDDYAKGAFYGLTLNHDRAHIHRAIMEAVAFGFKNIVVNFENNNIPVDQIICTGGVTFDKVWMQILADITGKEFIINENTNYGTLLGPAILGAVGSGSFKDLSEAANQMVHKKESINPNFENTEKYEPIFEDYLRLYHSTKVLNV